MTDANDVPKLTPEQARKLLTEVGQERSKKDMLLTDTDPNAEKFTVEDGPLMDGAHRLKAQLLQESVQESA